MPPSSSAARALHRVFITPTHHLPPPSVPLLYAPALCSQHTALQHFFLGPALICIRTKSTRRDTARHSLTDTFTLDTAIRSPTINLVTSTGTFLASQSTAAILTSLDRSKEHLVEVAPGRVDSLGIPDPAHLPTCKVMSRQALREWHGRKLDLARREKKGKGAGLGSKSMELNWAIAEGDLKHRLGKLREFLEEGRKVEVMFGPKKRGKQATAAEAKGLLERVEEVVNDVRGASEVKKEGVVGGVMLVVFEGSSQLRKQREREKELEREKEKEVRKKKEDEEKAKESVMPDAGKRPDRKG